MEALRQELEAAQAKLAKAEASRAKLRSHVAVLKVHAKNALTLIDEHRKLQEAHAELASELQQAQEQLQEQADLEQQLQQALQDKAAEAARARKAEQQLQHQAKELAQLQALNQADGLELQRLRHDVAALRQQQPAAPEAGVQPPQDGVDPSRRQGPAAAAGGGTLPAAAPLGPPASVQQQQMEQGGVLGMPSMFPPGAPPKEAVQQLESMLAWVKAFQAAGTSGGCPVPGNPPGGSGGEGATDHTQQQQQQQQDGSRQSPDPSPAQPAQHSTDAGRQQQRQRQQLVAPAATSRAGSMVDGPGPPVDPQLAAVAARPGLQLPGEARAASGSPTAHQAGAGGPLGGGGSSGGAAVTPLGGWGSCSTDSPGEPAATGPATAGDREVGRGSSCAVPAAGAACAGGGDAGGGLAPQDSDGVDWGLGRCPSVAPSSAGDFPGHASRSSTLPGLFDSTDSDSEGWEGTDRASRGRPIPRQLPAEMIAAAAAAGAMAAAAAGRNTAAAARSRSRAAIAGEARAAGGTSREQQAAATRQQAAAALELAFGTSASRQQEAHGMAVDDGVEEEGQQQSHGQQKQQRSSGNRQNSGSTTGSRGGSDRGLLKKNQKRYQKLVAVTKAKELATQPLEVKEVLPAVHVSKSTTAAANARPAASPNKRRQQQQGQQRLPTVRAAAATPVSGRVAAGALRSKQQGPQQQHGASGSGAVPGRVQPQQQRHTELQPCGGTQSSVEAPLSPTQKAAALLAAAGFGGGRKRGAPAAGRGVPGKVPRTGAATTPAAAAAAAADPSAAAAAATAEAVTIAGAEPAAAAAAATGVPSVAVPAGLPPMHPAATAGQQQPSAGRQGPIAPQYLPPEALPAAALQQLAGRLLGELSAAAPPAAPPYSSLDQHVPIPVPVPIGQVPLGTPPATGHSVAQAPGGPLGVRHLPPALQLPPANIRALLRTHPPPGRKGWAHRLLQQRDAAAAGAQHAPPLPAAAAASQQAGPSRHAAPSSAAQQATAAACSPVDVGWVSQQLQRLWSPEGSPAAVTAVSQQLAAALIGEQLKLDDFLLGCRAAVEAMAAAGPHVVDKTPAEHQQLPACSAAGAGAACLTSRPALLAQCVAQVGQWVHRKSAIDQHQSPATAAAAGSQPAHAAVTGATALPHSVCGVLMLGVLAAMQPWAPLAQPSQPDHQHNKQQQQQQEQGQGQKAVPPALAFAAVAAAGGAGQAQGRQHMDLHTAAAACAVVAHMQLLLGGGVAAVLQLAADLLMAAGSIQPPSASAAAAGGATGSLGLPRNTQQQQHGQQPHVEGLPALPLVAAVVTLDPEGWAAAMQNPGSTQVPHLAAAVKGVLLDACLAAQQLLQMGTEGGVGQQEAAAQQAAAESLLQLGRQHWGWPPATGQSPGIVLTGVYVEQHVAAIRHLVGQLQQLQVGSHGHPPTGGQLHRSLGGQDVAAAVLLHASQLSPAVVEQRVLPDVGMCLEEATAGGGKAAVAAASGLLASLRALARRAGE